MYDTYIFDVDDTLYSMDNDLHMRIKQRIIKQAQSDQGLQGYIHEWLGERRDIRESDLGVIFPYIVMHYQKISDDTLKDYLDTVYGDDYDLINPCPELVDKISQLITSGKNVYLYTNGPSYIGSDQIGHVQKVLYALGFDHQQVQYLSGHTYDLIMSVTSGHAKPSKKGFANMLDYFNLKASKKIVFFDDGLKNLLTAKDSKVSPVWIWNSSCPPKSRDTQMAQENDIPLSSNISEFLLTLKS